jgi:hypothetical protein
VAASSTLRIAGDLPGFSAGRVDGRAGIRLAVMIAGATAITVTIRISRGAEGI